MSRFSPSKSKRRSGKKKKPTYRGGGKSSYIPVEDRDIPKQTHAGAILKDEIPYGTYVTDREFQNKVSKDLTSGYVSRCSKNFIMGGGDKIDTIRQEVDNLLHNRKRLDVFGREEDRVEVLRNQKDLLYGAKALPDGTVRFSKKSTRKNRIKFYEGYHTQDFEGEHVTVKTANFEYGIEDLKQVIDKFDRSSGSGKKRKLTQTTFLDMSPKKFN